MELISISLARLVAIIDVRSLDPSGKETVPELFSEFGTRYAFTQTPKSLAEMDLTKGVLFGAGRFGDIAIDLVTLYANGFVIDTRSSTDNCEAIFEHIMSVAREALGATIESTRRHYSSQIYFRSDMDMSLLNPSLKAIANKVSRKVSADLNHQMDFEPAALLFNVDTSQLNIAPSQITIERKTAAPFSDKIYFSLAPLRTKEHLELLSEIESIML